MASPRVRLLRNAPQRQTMRLAARRRKRRILLGVLAAVLCSLLIGGVIYLTHLPQFMIQAVEIRGAHDVQETVIKRYVLSVLDDGRMHLFSPRTIFAYPKITISAGLREQLPRLATVAISRPSLLSTTLIINVTERSPYALWCTGVEKSVCYDVDASGFVYAQTDLATTTGYVTLLGGVLKPEDPLRLYVAPEHFTEVKDLLSGLTSAGYEAHTLSILTGNDLEVVLDNDLHVRGSFDLSADEMIANLALSMNTDSLRAKEGTLDYIDLRFGNRVYYKFK